MPPLNEGEEDDLGPDLRSDIQSAFEQFDAGKLNADNALTFEIPENPPAKKEAAADQSGSRQGERGRPALGEPASSPATDTQDKTSRERPRDDGGRFAKAPDRTAEQPQPGAQAPAKEGSQDLKAQPAPADPNAPQPPASFSDAGRQAWAQLHPEIRTHMAETERQYQARIAEYAQPIAPIVEMAQRRGMSWQEGMQKLVAAQQHLERNPMEALIWLAQAHRVDIDALADLAAGLTPQGGQPAPANHQLTGALDPINQRLQKIESHFTQQQTEQQQRQQAERQAARDAVTREFNTFASKNPGFTKVEHEVYALIPSIRQANPSAPVADVIHKAYEKASWADPELRAAMIEDQRKAEEAQRREQNGHRVRQARAAEIVTTHRGAGAPAPAANGQLSLKDEIAANWDAWEAQRQ